MKNFFFIILFFGSLVLGCGQLNDSRQTSPELPASGDNPGSADGTVDDAITQDFPTPGGGEANTPGSTKGKKEKDPAGSGGKPAGGGGGAGGGGAQNCNAVFEDGYWKTWAKGQSKPDLPASGPAPANACKETTSSDTTGGSTNGQSAGNQRVLLKTADGCYVPNGGGPVGPLLGACTGLTWKVPY